MVIYFKTEMKQKHKCWEIQLKESLKEMKSSCNIILAQKYPFWKKFDLQLLLKHWDVNIIYVNFSNIFYWFCQFISFEL